MSIEVTLENEQSEALDEPYWARFASAVTTELALANNVELSIRFVDAPTITELNERYLSHEGPTDVLSFPIEDDVLSFSSPANTQASAPLLLGDIVICPQVAKQQALEHDHSYEDELALLITHGLLHLIGLDHKHDEQAEEMEAKERELLSRFHRTSGTSS